MVEHDIDFGADRPGKNETMRKKLCASKIDALRIPTAKCGGQIASHTLHDKPSKVHIILNKPY